MTDTKANEPDTSEPPDTDTDTEREREFATVKKPKGHGSHRITPPSDIRSAVEMEADEPWTWFWHADSGRFFIRRSGASLSGIPDDVEPTGVSESRQNGRYLDYAIPVGAVEKGGMTKGQEWEFIVLDGDTMQLVKQ